MWYTGGPKDAFILVQRPTNRLQRSSRSELAVSERQQQDLGQPRRVASTRGAPSVCRRGNSLLRLRNGVITTAGGPQRSVGVPVNWLLMTERGSLVWQAGRVLPGWRWNAIPSDSCFILLQSIVCSLVSFTSLSLANALHAVVRSIPPWQRLGHDSEGAEQRKGAPCFQAPSSSSRLHTQSTRWVLAACPQHKRGMCHIQTWRSTSIPCHAGLQHTCRATSEVGTAHRNARNASVAR